MLPEEAVKIIDGENTLGLSAHPSLSRRNSRNPSPICQSARIQDNNTLERLDKHGVHRLPEVKSDLQSEESPSRPDVRRASSHPNLTIPKQPLLQHHSSSTYHQPTSSHTPTPTPSSTPYPPTPGESSQAELNVTQLEMEEPDDSPRDPASVPPVRHFLEGKSRAYEWTFIATCCCAQILGQGQFGPVVIANTEVGRYLGTEDPGELSWIAASYG